MSILCEKCVPLWRGEAPARHRIMSNKHFADLPPLCRRHCTLAGPKAKGLALWRANAEAGAT